MKTEKIENSRTVLSNAFSNVHSQVYGIDVIDSNDNWIINKNLISCNIKYPFLQFSICFPEQTKSMANYLMNA